jgi:hypothetical protein
MGDSLLILNSASISSTVFSIWRDMDSTEVLYTWDAMLERTVQTYSREKEYPTVLRILLAMVLYQQLEEDNRLN